jgi:2',3'-cyclic-nucleotide 2'-phosphodiesterase (5'-nucleotidase family)
MVALMNQVGFNATALGNHEFDVQSLPPLIGLSNFSYICANISPKESTGLHIVPTKVLDVDGLKVGIIGAIQVNQQGRPDTHPDNLKDIRFSLPKNAIARYHEFSRRCNATILLSHVGYEGDLELAKTYPWLNLIIGGHTHTQLSADEPLHHGVLITQNKNKLQKVTHITLTLKHGRVTGKKAEYIDVKSFPKKNELVEAMVEHFSDNPLFQRVVAQADVPFTERDQLTFMMCDALLSECDADISIINNGGVRIDSLEAGDITMKDVLSMDPFYNDTFEMTLTGEEVLKILTTYSRGSLYHLPRVGGIICEAIVDKEDPDKDRLKNVRLKTLDGQEFDIHKTYKVITNSYMASIIPSFIDCTPHSLNIETSKILTNFIGRFETVNYQGVNRLLVTEE